MRRSDERAFVRRDEQRVWHSFYAPNPEDPLGAGFSSLEVLAENQIPPGSGVWLSSVRSAEILTYVRRGRVQWRGGPEQTAGEIHRFCAHGGIRHRLVNASTSETAHVFQLWFRMPDGEAPPADYAKVSRVATADRRGQLQQIASGRSSSNLTLRADAEIFSGMLAEGQHIAHPCATGRRTWLHVVTGRLVLGELVLSGGDGVGGAFAPILSCRAETAAELLVVDLE